MYICSLIPQRLLREERECKWRQKRRKFVRTNTMIQFNHKPRKFFSSNIKTNNKNAEMHKIIFTKM